MNTSYPLNPRDEDQPILPHGNKALFVTLGIFFAMIITTVLLLNYATAPEVQYSNYQSDAAGLQPTRALFPTLIPTTVPTYSMDTVPDALDKVDLLLDSTIDINPPRVPDVSL